MENLYEEVINDVRDLQARAEDVAKRKYLESVTPKIRELIKDKLCESLSEAEETSEPDEPESKENKDDKELLSDDSKSDGDELDEEASQTASEIRESSKPDIKLASFELREEAQRLLNSGKKIKSTNGYRALVKELSTRVRDMYHCAVESKNGNAANRLDETHKILIEETFRMKNRISEEDLTLKLSGLGDVDIDDVNVELVSDESGGEEGGESDDLDLDLDTDSEGGAEGAPEGGEEDLDMDGGDQGAEGAQPPPAGEEDEEEEQAPAPPARESRSRGRDVVLEVDESALKRELALMSEGSKPTVPSGQRHPQQAAKKKIPAEVLTDFGGGDDEGDPWLDQGEVRESLECESDEDDNTQEEGADMMSESVIKNEMSFQRDMYRAAVKAGKTSAARLAEGRYNSLKQKLAKVKKPIAEGHANRAQGRETVNESRLRAQLVESQLNNAKLYYASKLLRIGLPSQTANKAMQQLDKAKTRREVQLVFESIEQSVTRKGLNENTTRSRGSSSAPVTSSAPRQPAQADEIQRWSKLAGLPAKLRDT